MIIKLLFICFILFILKQFIVKFNYYDYFFVTLSFLLILFNYLYIINGEIKFMILILLISIILIIYSYNKFDNSDSSIIILDGNINIKNMIKNKYSLFNLLNDLKVNRVGKINNKTCGILVNNKLEIFYRNKTNNKVISMIINGNVCYNELKKIGKDNKWLEYKLNNTNIDSILYSFYFNNVLYIIKK